MPNRIRQVLRCLVTLLLLFGNGASTNRWLRHAQAVRRGKTAVSVLIVTIRFCI